MLIRMHARNAAAPIRMCKVDPLIRKIWVQCSARRRPTRQLALKKVHRARINIGCLPIRHRRDFQVVISEIHAASHAARIAAIRNPRLIDLGPRTSTIHRPPNSLIHNAHAIARDADKPEIHLIAPRHHRQLPAINRTSRIAVQNLRRTIPRAQLSRIRLVAPAESSSAHSSTSKPRDSESPQKTFPPPRCKPRPKPKLKLD